MGLNHEERQQLSRKIAVIGLGYVGLPIALEFSKSEELIGFDINQDRVNWLKKGKDKNKQHDRSEINNEKIKFSSNEEDLTGANFYIITVPTPVDAFKNPDFTPLIKASEMIGKHLAKGDIVVYESTVYPGATEEVCIPILEKQSKLCSNDDFHVGYSPERINPGDSVNKLRNIVKIVAAQNDETLKVIESVYDKIVNEIYCAPSIKVAEASKVIENTQRDVNIALINEFCMLFNKMGIDTNEVLDAAATKWNFIGFKPGLVGGHCIAVDSYYLAHKARLLEMDPELIVTSRKINDYMSKFIATQTVKRLAKQNARIGDAHICILGLTYKENCPDLRSTKIVDMVKELKSFGAKVSVIDPLAELDEAAELLGFPLSNWEDIRDVNAVVVAVAHEQFKDISVPEFNRRFGATKLVVDVKSIYSKEKFAGSPIELWRI